MKRWAQAFSCLVLAALGLVGCATTKAQGRQPGPVAGAVEQPFRDLSLIRDESPAALTIAASAPYALDAAADCAAMRTEISALDAALGPDVDAPPTADRGQVEALVGDAVRGAVNLPFRGVVRRITGAEAHDRVLRRAVTAAVARRGFLRGVAVSRGCDNPHIAGDAGLMTWINSAPTARP